MNSSFLIRTCPILIATALLLSFSCFAKSSAAPQIAPSVTAPAVALGDAFSAVADNVKASVVSVLSEKVVKSRNDLSPFPFGDDFLRRFFGESPQFSQPHRVPISGLGSGVIIDGNGHVLTNNHVVQGMEKIKITLTDKRSFDAVVVGTDAKTDIAVIKFKGKVPDDLTYARLGNSDSLKPGHLVLAFGAPFGLTQTVTSGIISATGRSDVGIADFEDFLQTDAPINPGNSGGPLVNINGEVVGINTAIATSIGQSAGVGFAIPINMAKDILPTLLRGKKVVRGMLGVVVQDLTSSLATQFHLENTKGALVSQVNSNTPAEKDGLKAGDVITKYDGKSVEDARHLREMVAKTAPGQKRDIEVVRGGKPVTLSVTVGVLTAETAKTLVPQPEQPLAQFGIQAQNITPELAQEFRIKERKGVVITNVDETSPAGLGGLQPGDLITEADRQSVDNMEELKKAIAKSKDTVLLLIKHHGQSMYVTLTKG